MADDVSRMLIEVKVKDGEASIRQLKSVGKAAKGAGEESGYAAKKIKEHSDGYNKLSKAATAVSVGGLALVAGATVEAAKAGVKWQAQIVSLTTTLKNQHQFTKNAAKEIGDLTERGSEKGGFGAEEQLGGIKQFLAETHSRAQAIKDNADAENLARATGQEYAQAQKLVAMALTGNIGRLEKQLGYIPKVTEHTKALSQQESARLTVLKAQGQYTFSPAEQKAFELQRQRASLLDKEGTKQNALNIIQKKGQDGMLNYSHTLKGMWEDLKHQLDNVLRTVGTAILPALTKVFKLVLGVVTWFVKHKEITIILGAVAVAIWAMATALSVYNTYLETRAAIEKILAVESLASWGLVAIAIIAIVVIVVELIKHWKLVKQVADEVFKFVLNVIKSVWTWIKQNWPYLLPILIGPLGFVVLGFLKFKKQIIGIFEDVINWIETAFNNVLNFLESIPQKIVNAFMKLPHMLGSILNKIPGVGLVSHALGSIGLNSGGLVPGFASGGVVPGYGFSDTIPAMLTPGEFVVRKQAVQSIGVGTLNAMNGTNQTNPVGGSDGGEYVPIQIINKIDSRVVSESTARYVLKKKRQL